MMNPVLPKQRRRPPDSAQPEGCPGNPSQQSSYEFLFPLVTIDHEGSPRREGADRITLYYLRSTEKSADVVWSGEDLVVDLAQSTCQQATIRENLPNGMTACRVKPIHDTRVEDWGASYVADPAVYSTPLGRPFGIHCGPLIYSWAGADCQVAYSITPGLGVGYKIPTLS